MQQQQQEQQQQQQHERRAQYNHTNKIAMHIISFGKCAIVVFLSSSYTNLLSKLSSRLNHRHHHDK